MISAGEPPSGARTILGEYLDPKAAADCRLWGRRVEEQPAAVRLGSFPAPSGKHPRRYIPRGGAADRAPAAATEAGGTRPADRMRRARRRGSGAPRRAKRRTGKTGRGPEEARPAPTTGPRRRAREPAPRRAPPAASVQPTCGPGASPGRSERGGGGATAGEDSTHGQR